MSKRDLGIDASKGMLILMVVYAHCFTNGALHDFFFSFHMPAFFMISGITSAISRESEEPLCNTVLKLLRTHGIPYIFFETLGIIQTLIRNGIEQSWKGFLFNTLTLRCNNVVDWFLGTLLIAKLLSIVLRKILQKILKQSAADVIYITISAIAMVTAILIPRTEPFLIVVIRRILIAQGFLAIGVILEPVLRRKALVFGLTALAVAFGLSLLNTEFADLNELHFGIPAVFLGAALMGSYGMIQLGKKLVWRPLLWLGKNSLIIMGTHIPILLLARYIAGTTAPTLWHRLFDLVLIIALEIPIAWLLNRFTPFLIGKRSQRNKSLQRTHL